MITVEKGDITYVTTDAIVNAANTSLLGGGGVDGAIHRRGGPQILKECRAIGGCAVGEAVITTGGLLLAKYVIHTVGPVWRGGGNNEEALLTSAYANSLRLAESRNISSIAFPNISTGVYGFPKPLAARIAVETVGSFMASTRVVKKTIFVCFDEENYALYKGLLEA